MKDTNRILKGRIIELYGTHKNFLLSLQNGRNGIEMTENRLTRIVTGRTLATRNEMRAFAWKLQKPINELFPEGG